MAPNPAMDIDVSHPLPLDQWTRWQELANACAEPNAFYAPPMLGAALTHMARPGEVHLIEAYRGEELIGLLPVSVSRRHGRLPFSHAANWMHEHCFLGVPLIRRGHEAEAWASFLERLDNAPWAGAFLYLRGIDAAGATAAALEAVCAAQQRPLREAFRHERALLRSELDAETYWQTHVRSKKRKELRRLERRLEEMGAVTHETLTNQRELTQWCTEFLQLEASGWKGGAGTALSSVPAQAAFFRSACAAAMDAGQLLFLKIALDGKPVAMLANFLHGEGGFSFKIAIDEEHGRFSPGIFIEIDNLHAVQGNPDIAWMDSCAAPDHPMIDSLWAERRTIVQYRIGLRGKGMTRLVRSAALGIANGAEDLAAWIKGK